MPKALVARPPLDAVEERTIRKLARAAHLDLGPDTVIAKATDPRRRKTQATSDTQH